MPSSVRKEMSIRVHSLNSQNPPYPELFDPVQPALRKQLNELHSQFVTSDSFMAVSPSLNSPSLTLVLRENGQPPMVAKIPSELITLARFRRTFGIARSENRRFLFKSTCEDGSAPFQWSLITDEDAVLPMFDGKITAECRHFTDSD
ncbi:unnamed protein product [Haemonchus placei]|uniref:DIX domain-containing protein n=1 Tax=Haemonchus placei TaxID=6290 RepID=A0A3P7YSX1_HAEPC|nr:unnamed protein product [Haemonchus placei]